MPPSPREEVEGAGQVTTSPVGQAGVQEGAGEAVVQRAVPGAATIINFFSPFDFSL